MPATPAPRTTGAISARRLDLPADIARATLLITADSAYELHVNGAFAGRGPVRGFPFAYFYDVYDVTRLLQGGRIRSPSSPTTWATIR